MRIQNKDKRYKIDREELTRCMQDLGFHEHEINRLNLTINRIGTKNIQVEEAADKVRIYGRFSLTASITVYTHGRLQRRVTHTILHELSHYLDKVKEDRKIDEALMLESDKAFEQFMRVLHQNNLSSKDIPYEERPEEIRANEIADKLYLFYHIVQ